MLPFFKKDFLIYWRDRKEMTIALIAPIILIIVLSFALPNWVENPSEVLGMKVGIVKEDNEAAGLQSFIDSLQSYSLDSDQATAIAGQAEQLQPAMLLTQVLESDEIGAFMETIEMDSVAALQQLEAEEIIAIITIPDGYTRASLNKMLLNEGEGSTLSLIAEDESLKVDVLQSIVEGFMQTMNDQLALGYTSTHHGLDTLNPNNPTITIGGHETIEGFQMITSFQYYTVSTSIIFALFISMTTAMKAITEKREHVLHRILLTGSHPIRYLTGKVSSTFCMSLLQLIFVFLVCHFILQVFPGRSLQFWLGMTVIMLVFCFSVAAMSSFFTSLAFRMKEQEASGLMTFIIILIGTIGGSFVPVYVLPGWLRGIGEWTPNGLSLSMYIQWIQQGDFPVIIIPLLQLVSFSLIVIIAAIFLFPRRGRI